MNKEDPTHVLFDWEKIIVSPNLIKIFEFLSDIDKEIWSILNFQSQLNNIRESFLNTLEATEYLAKKIEENNIEINFKTKEDLTKISDKFEFNLPIRSQFIILFSYLEVLFILVTSFEREIDDNDKLRDFCMNKENTRKFISDFILNISNDYFKENTKKFWWITPTGLRDLRNSLIHFFSVSWKITLMDDRNEKENNKLINKFRANWINDVNFITSQDLYKLLSKWTILFIKNLSNTFLTNPKVFERKIKYTKKIVDTYASVLLNYNSLK